jgi:hypothetical protein
VLDDPVTGHTQYKPGNFYPAERQKWVFFTRLPCPMMDFSLVIPDWRSFENGIVFATV